MTTIETIIQKCAICGKKSERTIITSSFSMGHRNLDTRPSSENFDEKITCCPYCGYCDNDITEVTPKIKRAVESEEYQRIRKSTVYPKGALSHVSAAHIYEKLTDFVTAGWFWLKAAWLCDDKKDTENAIKCRKRAAELFQKARKNSEQFAKSTGIEDSILMDIYRRIGDFGRAQKTCQNVLGDPLDETSAKVLNFQLQLIGQKDVGSHTIEEAASGVKEEDPTSSDEDDDSVSDSNEFEFTRKSTFLGRLKEKSETEIYIIA